MRDIARFLLGTVGLLCGMSYVAGFMSACVFPRIARGVARAQAEKRERDAADVTRAAMAQAINGGQPCR